MEIPSDAELLTRFQAGDASALDGILNRYERPLFLFLLGTLRDHHRAEDALQETFVQALERLRDVDPEHLKGWLFTVAYHQAMLSKRRQAARQRHFPVAGDAAEEKLMKGDDPAAVALAQEAAEQCRKLVDQLPEKQRELIRMRMYEGKRFRDIADELGCPLNTALARMHQALKKLREMGDFSGVEQ